MIRIGLLSDTHSYIHPKSFDFFKDCDEIWHAGDVGNAELVNTFSREKPFFGVYGNIDGPDIRNILPEFVILNKEDLKVLMIHIGGYPGRYDAFARELIMKHRPGLFICGHSHILKVIYDKKYDLLHINPGAAGRFGSHNKITMVRFKISGKDIRELEIFESER